MSGSLVLIMPPAQEPIQLAEFKAFLELPASDTSRDAKLMGFLVAAREDCERTLRIKLLTQTWLLRLDSFPGINVMYERNGYPLISLPYPPFQSVDFVRYVDVAGAVQELYRDTTYGNELTPSFYAYQIEPGGGVKPARVMPTWARPYPPNRLVPASVLVQFRCGFGGPLTVSMDANSKALTIAGSFPFNPDDAPLMVGDTGTKIRVPGAGPQVANAPTDLVTTIAAVDADGNATLADSATTAVADVRAWLGSPIPEALRTSIMFHSQFFFEQGAVVDQALPRVVASLRSSYRNMVS